MSDRCGSRELPKAEHDQRTIGLDSSVYRWVAPGRRTCPDGAFSERRMAVKERRDRKEEQKYCMFAKLSRNPRHRRGAACGSRELPKVEQGQRTLASIPRFINRLRPRGARVATKPLPIAKDSCRFHAR